MRGDIGLTMGEDYRYSYGRIDNVIVRENVSVRFKYKTLHIVTYSVGVYECGYKTPHIVIYRVGVYDCEHKTPHIVIYHVGVTIVDIKHRI